jgi:hypothetical protein
MFHPAPLGSAFGRPQGAPTAGRVAGAPIPPRLVSSERPARLLGVWAPRWDPWAGAPAIWRGRPVSPTEHHRTGRVAEQPPTNRRGAGVPAEHPPAVMCPFGAHRGGPSEKNPHEGPFKTGSSNRTSEADFHVTTIYNFPSLANRH